MAIMLLMRTQLLTNIRQFFAKRSCLEVTTPLFDLSTNPDPNIESFVVPNPSALTTPFYLQTSPEFAMKKLLVEGSGDIYQICPAFRVGEQGKMHSPEFTMLEWYRVGLDHVKLMDEVAELLQDVLQPTNFNLAITENNRRDKSRLVRLKDGDNMIVNNSERSLSAQLEDGNEIVINRRDNPRVVRAEVGNNVGLNLAPPKFFTYSELFKSYLNLDPLEESIANLRRVTEQHKLAPHKLSVADLENRDFWLNLLFGGVIEPKLTSDFALQNRAVFIHAFPASQAALAKLNPKDRRVAERFEVYINGIELGNGFHELTDAAEQRARFSRDIETRRAQGKHVPPLPEYFLQALDKGLPDSAGVAVGFDRLLMLVLHSDGLAKL